MLRKTRLLLFIFLFSFCLYFVFLRFLPLTWQSYDNKDLGVKFSYPKAFNLEISEFTSPHSPPFVMSIELENRGLHKFVDMFGDISGYTTAVKMLGNDEGCDQSLETLMKHKLVLFNKPSPTNVTVKGITIYDLNNVPDQAMHEFQKFACVEKEGRSVFIAGVPHVWRDGKHLYNFQADILQKDSFLLFKSIVKNIELQ